MIWFDIFIHQKLSATREGEKGDSRDRRKKKAKKSISRDHVSRAKLHRAVSVRATQKSAIIHVNLYFAYSISIAIIDKFSDSKQTKLKKNPFQGNFVEISNTK